VAGIEVSGDAGRRLAMSDFDYDLPHELIAQEPLSDRSASRLMVLDPDCHGISHHSFTDLPGHLDPGDLLVLNDSRVIPARLVGKRETGGEVELLLLRETIPRQWLCLMRPARRLRIKERVRFADWRHPDADVATATVVEKRDDGQGIVELDGTLAGHLEDYGRVPLPPYIHHHLEDQERYQTVYAAAPGSAAAPTAGLHFTDDVFAALTKRGIETARVTLHVGLDTFRPVTADYAEDHVIHKEWCSVPAEAAEAIALARRRGSKVVAVGTTAARTLESYGRHVGGVPGEPFSGMTGIYITPGYEWTMVDAMVTNFHLPKSTLLLMMSAFAGKELLFAAYREAIRERYRFFSFGDAMLVRSRARQE
jgi:S-adenosylmethionine:tRNA ribosyltransferase-isomerase